jgi:hypothetical protein
MPLSPNGLANEIFNSIKGRLTSQNAASQFMPELGHAIARYLTKNTSVMYAWSGIQPGTPPVPDPVVTYTTKQVVGDFACSPTMTPDPVTHGIILGKQITEGIRTFKIMPASGWAVPPGGFLCAPQIILPPYPQADTYQYWLMQSSVILTFYKMWIKPTPLMGAHGSFIAPPGAGAIMSLIF